MTHWLRAFTRRSLEKKRCYTMQICFSLLWAFTIWRVDSWRLSWSHQQQRQWADQFTYNTYITSVCCIGIDQSLISYLVEVLYCILIQILLWMGNMMTRHRVSVLEHRNLKLLSLPVGLCISGSSIKEIQNTFYCVCLTVLQVQMEVKWVGARLHRRSPYLLSILYFGTVLHKGSLLRRN